MQNETSEYGIAEEISSLLNEHFLSKGLLQLASDEQADSRLTLTLISLSEQTTQYTADQEVNTIRVTIKVKALFEDLVEGGVLWESQLSSYGDYDPNSEERADAIQLAVEEMVNRINEQMLADW